MFACRSKEGHWITLDNVSERTILSFLLYLGPQKWTPRQHWKWCGQACECCRTEVGEEYGTCPPCVDGIAVAGASKAARAASNAYGQEHNHTYMHCTCGECEHEWLHRGWICPVLGREELQQRREDRALLWTHILRAQWDITTSTEYTDSD